MKKHEMHAEDPMAAYIQSKKKTKTKKVHVKITDKGFRF